jgi:hypothetical protein
MISMPQKPHSCSRLQVTSSGSGRIQLCAESLNAMRHVSFISGAPEILDEPARRGLLRIQSCCRLLATSARPLYTEQRSLQSRKREI